MNLAPTILDETVPASEEAAWLRPFTPRRGLRNPHLQTIAGNFLRRPSMELPAPKELIIPVEPAHRFCVSELSVEVSATSILCLGHWQPGRARTQGLTVVLVHGLEGSASSGYVLGNTARLWAAGCNVIRMNMRSCGGSDTLAPTIYHSGRSEDVAAVVDTLIAQHGARRIVLVGYSMGGNLVLKYAGEHCHAIPQLAAIVGVSPLMDLAPSSAALHQWSNRLYEQRFLRAMKRRLRRKALLFPELYGSLEQQGVYTRIRTMRDFDGEIVAHYGGFRDADDYYEQVRSSRYAGTLQVPTLILHAQDDPFIRTLPATREALLGNPFVRYVETGRGGHCAFLANPDETGDGRWAEDTIAAWLTREFPV